MYAKKVYYTTMLYFWKINLQGKKLKEHIQIAKEAISR